MWKRYLETRKKEDLQLNRWGRQKVDLAKKAKTIYYPEELYQPMYCDLLEAEEDRSSSDQEKEDDEIATGFQKLMLNE